MLIGYARVSKSDGSQVLDLQMDALKEAGVKPDMIFFDRISGAKKDRPGLSTCLRALRKDDKLIVWSLDRLGRNLRHLINLIKELEDKGVSFKVLNGQGKDIDTSTPHGKMIFSIFGALAEFEREMIRERTLAGLKAARQRGKNGGRRFALTKAQVRLAESSMGKKETVVSHLCKELGVTRATLYRYVAPNGQLREAGERVLGKTNWPKAIMKKPEKRQTK